LDFYQRESTGRCYFETGISMNAQEYNEDDQAPVEHSPFDGSVEGQAFFPGGHRRETLDAMLEAISAGVPILTLTGEDGSGKTMMCRMIEERMSTGHVVVFFPRTIDSFEEVVRIVAHRLEVGTAVGGVTTGLLQSVISDIHSRNIHLLLIFDEAERIYLATLERVRKMLDLTNGPGVFMQIVLSGGIGLHNNFKHLALCNFQQVEERQFSLAALTGDETYEYLHFALRDAEPERQGIFTRQLAARIFSTAKGNLRSTNSLAEESLQVLTASTTTPLLSDSGVQEAKNTARPPRRLKKPAAPAKGLPFNKRYLAWGGGAAGLALVALLLFQPDRKPAGPTLAIPPEATDPIVISQLETTERRSESSAVIPVEEEIDEKNEQTGPVAPSGPPKESGAEQEQPAASAAVVRPETVTAEETPAAAAEATRPVSPVQTVREAVEENTPEVPVTPPQATVPEKRQAEHAEVSQPVGSDQENSSSRVTVDRPVPEPEPEAQTPETPVEVVQPEAPARRQAATPARPDQATEEEKKAPEKPVLMAPPQNPRDENAAGTAGNRNSIAADQNKVIAPARILEAREVVKNQYLPPTADPVAVVRDPAKIIKSQEKTIIAEVPIPPVMIKAERKEQPTPAAEPTPLVPAEPKTVTAKVVEKDPVPARKEESVERIYNRRIAAGSTWLLGNKDDRYTIQLMVVTSGDAEKKVKNMLAQEEYRGQADKFYILRKESNPGVQYIYYGEYPTMTDARNARNTMPGFLRGHRPYALSVKGAVQKALEDE
jgi:type II secretory pathway predicted ATPase ExeA